jgi:hypothetical protein
MSCDENAKNAANVGKYYGAILSPKILKKSEWEKDCLSRGKNGQ